MKTPWDACERSFSLSRPPAHDAKHEHQTEHNPGSPAEDREPQAVGISAIGPIAGGVARQTWVHDHDLLEWRYVN